MHTDLNDLVLQDAFTMRCYAIAKKELCCQIAKKPIDQRLYDNNI